MIQIVTNEFKNAIGLVFFDGSLTEEGKIILKSKTYRNIVDNVGTENLYKVLKQLGQLSAHPFIGAEK